MDIEITPDQPRFCPRCHKEVPHLTVGAMDRHHLHLPEKPVDPIKELERVLFWAMVLPAVLMAMLAAARYCGQGHHIDGGAIGARSAMFLSGGAALLTGMLIRKLVIRFKRRGAKNLEYETALENWRDGIRLFQRLRVCEECQLIIDDNGSMPFGRLEAFLGRRGAHEETAAQPERCNSM
jgi:hypothetical protein